MEIRRARTKDAAQIHALINHYANTQQMLPRNLLSVYENIRDFHVAVEPDGNVERVLGCSGLHFTWGDMAEVRSLAVDPNTGRRGLGRALVEANIAEAREHDLIQIYAFTYVPQFFSKLGFHVVQHESMPRKVWMDCVTCNKFNSCDEIPMVLELVPGAQPEAFDISQVRVPVVQIGRQRPDEDSFRVGCSISDSVIPDSYISESLIAVKGLILQVYDDVERLARGLRKAVARGKSGESVINLTW